MRTERIEMAVCIVALFVRNVRHDLPHLHRLTGRHVLNTDNNLVIGRSRRGLKQFPKTLYQFPLIFRQPT